MGLERLNEYKKKKGVTNAQLAEITGLTLSTIDKITSGYNQNPKLGTVKLLCRALDCTLDDLLADEKCSALSDSNTYSAVEINFLKKYRDLDNYGKKAVESILDIEYDRCISISENEDSKPEIGVTYSKIYADEGGVTVRETPADLPKISDFFDD